MCRLASHKLRLQWDNLLLLLLTLMYPMGCMGKRAVLTFPTYDACQQWDNRGDTGQQQLSSACATLSKCYGRRLILNVVNCTFALETNANSLTEMEQWAQGIFALGLVDDATLLAEWDTMLVATDLTPMDATSNTLIGRVGDEYAQNSNHTSAVDAYNYDTALSQQGLPTDTVDGSAVVQNPSHLQQWNLDFLGVPQLWQAGFDGHGQVVAVLDSGVAASALPMFSAQSHQPSEEDTMIIMGYDFVSDIDLAKDGDGRDANPLDPGDADPDLCSSASWHGTYVSSVVASRRFDEGVFAGVAYNSTLLNMRVLGKCKSGYASDVADAIVWAVGGTINGMPDNPHPATILVMSFAGKGSCPTYLQSAVDLAINTFHATLFAAAGNDPSLLAADSFPANCKGVLSVGAMDSSGVSAPYSARQADLYLPGGTVDQPIPCVGPYLTVQQCVGTSMATPHAGGLMALHGGADWVAQFRNNSSGSEGNGSATGLATVSGAFVEGMDVLFIETDGSYAPYVVKMASATPAYNFYFSIPNARGPMTITLRMTFQANWGNWGMYVYSATGTLLGTYLPPGTWTLVVNDYIAPLRMYLTTGTYQDYYPMTITWAATCRAGYVKDPYMKKCVMCSSCPAGQTVQVACSPTSDTLCACPAGTARDAESGNCVPSSCPSNSVALAATQILPYPPAPLATTLTIDNVKSMQLTGVAYGAGMYHIDWSSDLLSGLWRPSHLFNGIYPDQFGGVFANAKYDGVTGYHVLHQPSFISSEYYGEWVELILPKRIALSHSIMRLRTNQQGSGPRSYRVYGSNNGSHWTTLIDVQNASYPSVTHTSKSIDQTNTYSMFLLVVNRIFAMGHNTLNFDEWVLHGSDQPKCSQPCTVCPAGKYAFAACNANGETDCRDCPAGSYSASAGAATCQACAGGSWSAQGMSTCVQCPAGTASIR